MENLLELALGIVIMVSAIAGIVWVLIKLLELVGYVGPILAPLIHFVFRVIPVVILLAVAVDPEDMFAYLALMIFWVPYYVLTRKEN